MQQVAAVIQRHPRWGPGREWVRLPKGMRRVLCAQLDFRWSRTAARFRKQFLEDPGIPFRG